jgi:hypothetical protein
VGLLVVVVAVVAIGAIGWFRYLPLIDDVRGVRDVASRLAETARTLDPADLDRATVAELRADLEDMDARLGPIRDAVAGDPLVSVAAMIPAVEPQIAAADALVAAADDLVAAGELGLGVADRFVDLREANDADPGFAMVPGLVGLMVESSDDVDRVAELVASAEAQLDEIPPDALRQVAEARDLVAEPLAAYGPLLEQYREADDVLPALLGWGQPRHYLVLAQNPAELRPGGGYSGTVGVITFEDGALVEQRFQDVYELDLLPDLPFIEAPPELSAFLLGDDQSWRLADATWSADFPTGARQALEFYELQSGRDDIDGVIAVTTFAIDRLLEVVGPVEVKAFDVTVAPGDTTMTLLGETRGTETSVEGRKEILDDLATTLVQRLLALPPDQWVGMAEALLEIGDEKLALAWFEDAAAQDLVAESGWAGAVAQGAGDYVYALESNVAPTSKYNLVVDRAASMVVKLDDTGDALNSIRLDWDNRADEPGEPFESLRDYSNNEEGWYGAYLRLLVPTESELITANGEALDPIRGSTELADDAGRSVYGNYLLMPPGESTLSYLWTSPGVAAPIEDGWEYRLFVQKQPGARDEPWTFRVDLPAGAEVIEVPEGAEVRDGRVFHQAVLDQDLELVLRYRL